ncbi:MAG: rRNA maturation RNase YbeY [Rhodospirillaceae bacterium]|nr:rRNA maturation RNase YbeY [Rhodospirillaceae bacterium]|tara:strand:+ start:30 stop:542 length:513 start_codon:yes stop_codon:yes gene_type:complete
MKEAEKDYKRWENKNFIVESSVISSLWDEVLISDFYKKINKVLNEIYEQLGLDYKNSKTLISISFSGDKKIMELNSYFRKKKSATNVLSFPSNYKFKNTLFLGDIIFSIETILKEAKRDHKTVENHLIHLFIHAVLHLLGYDHEKEEKAKIMENLEIQILSNLDIDNPYN